MVKHMVTTDSLHIPPISCVHISNNSGYIYTAELSNFWNLLENQI